jgi:transcriptional regulator NrdR family protein
LSKNSSCPFCGMGAAIIDTLNSANGKAAKYRVQCQVCMSSTRWCDTPEEAWKIWASRA